MKILVVAKPSKLEWDCFKTGKSHDELLEEYKNAGANHAVIKQSHDYQFAVRQGVIQVIQPYDLVSLSEFEKTHEYLLKDIDLVISLGGDNSFTRTSQFLDEQPLLGVNSDPVRSVGSLNSFHVVNVESIDNLKSLIEGKHLTVEMSTKKWNRIECELNGKKMRLSTSEIFLGERLRKNMSRYTIEQREFKSSGILVYTGAGSTGWACNLGAYAWRPEEKSLGYIHTERYSGPEDGGILHEQEELIVQSLNDDGIVSIDSWEEAPFNRGDVAKIRNGKPLSVANFTLRNGHLLIGNKE